MKKPSVFSMVGFGDECVICFLIMGTCLILGAIYLLYKSWGNSSERRSSSSVMSNLSHRVRSSNVDCCICLENVTFGVETNCGHVYCGACLLEFIYRSAILSAPNCPYCRQRITMVFLYFTPEESGESLSEADNKFREDLIEWIKSYNRSFSNEPRSVLEHIRDFSSLARRLWNMFWDEGLLYFRFRLIFPNIFIFIYLFCPSDILPESLFGIIGFLDDFLIIVCGAFYAVNFYRNFVAVRGLA
uniref:E3 ubiquitin-protein ligase RNF170 n=1 Tax=Caligus clemensi TaxID=344056 RepID=C1C3A2_CALCM|nr:RING finger protein 170 [Caligus clemensi]